MAKIKSGSTLKFSLQHNTRERIPSNAAPEKKLLNQIFGEGNSDEVMERYGKMLPQNVRKNAVVAVELVFTASKVLDGRSSWDSYLNACDKWTMDLFGAENLLHVAHHYDEETPHSHVLVVPLKNQKLNAKHFIGGSRNRMVELQDDFYEKVGKQFELERGQSRAETKARHSHHSLAGKANELDEREKILVGKEAKLNQAAAEFKQHFGMTAADVSKLKMLVANWDKTTPAGLEVIAKDIRQSGAATVGEYRQAREVQREREKNRSSSFSR